MIEHSPLSGRLLAFGSNGSGQLGIGHKDDVCEPTACQWSEETPLSPSSIVAGGNHTVILSAGSAFATGDNGNGRSSLAHTASHMRIQPMKLATATGDIAAATWTSCAATWEATLLVDKTSKVYVIGSGSKGELGCGEDVVSTSYSRQIASFPPDGTTIVQLSASMGHVVAVLSNGDAFGWGNGRKGQLGLPSAIHWRPRRIEEIPFKVSRAVCGREFTYFVGKPDDGHHLLLGSEKTNLKHILPSNVLDWVDVQASWSNLYVLFADGSLHSWGRNDHGQLVPSGLPRLSSMAVGSEHVLALTTDGRVLAWGWGEHGNCGPGVDVNGDVKGRWNEIHVAGDVSMVGAGCSTSWIWALSV